MRPSVLHSFSLAFKRSAVSETAVREKSDVRKQLRRLRSLQDPRAIQYKSSLIASALLSLPELQASRVTALYASLASEVSTDGLMEELLREGKRLALPKVIGDRLELYQVRDPARDLSGRGAFGIREPEPQRCERIAPEQVDLYLVPGVGFDLFGYRVGYGGGFYDRLLPQRRLDVAVIGLAFDFQIVHAIAVGESDVPVHKVVTEEQVYCPRRSWVLTCGESETRQLAHTLARRGLKGTVALHGDLGVGKTVWVKGLAEALNLREEAASPTFVFCREYRGAVSLYHADAYRIDSLRPDEEEFWAEMLEQPGIVAVEWGEKLGSLLPKNAAHLFGVSEGNETRTWTLFTPLQDQYGLHGE